MEKLTEEVKIVETQQVNGTPPTLTLTITGYTPISLTGCVGWIGHIETDPTSVTVTTTDPEGMQTLQSLMLSKAKVSGSFVFSGSTNFGLQFDNATISNQPPAVPRRPAPAAVGPGTFWIIS